MDIQTLLSSSIKQLGSNEASLEVQLLLKHVLKVNHAWLITHADDEISSEHYEQFQALLKRRLSGEPIAYILGEREFYGLTFKTTPDTLIPRPDTETLVNTALEKLSKDDSAQVLDLGTGTGAIALAIAKHRPKAHITAADYAEGALAVAKENAAYLSIHNVTFTQSNWFDALANQAFDVIVSNPPYIEEGDPHLSQGDLRFEPRAALTSGTDGLDDIRAIILGAKRNLKPGGWLMLEHGYNQANSVANLFKKSAFNHIAHANDLAGITRVTLASH